MTLLNTKRLGFPLSGRYRGHATGSIVNAPRIDAESNVWMKAYPFTKGLVDRISFLGPPIVVTGAAVLLLISSSVLNHRLRNRMQRESLNQAKQLSSLLAFQSRIEGMQIAKANAESYGRDAAEIEERLRQSTQRALLIYKLFPDPKDSSQLIFEEFANAYCRGIDRTLDRMQACQPPAPHLVQESRSRVLGRSANAMDASLYGSRVAPIDQKIIDILSEEKARAGRVYISPENLGGYSFWWDYRYGGHEQSLTDCWYGQLGYWITEDILTTVEHMNHASTNVLTSTVKRVLGIYFEHPRSSYPSYDHYGHGAQGRPPSTVPQSLPRYVAGVGDAMVPSLTGRLGDDQLDVMHFGLEVVVAADEMMAFMKELCAGKKHRFSGFTGDEPERTHTHNQITILGSEITPVVRSHPQHRYYRYGAEPVVHLKLTCEYLFERAAYDTIKPESVKRGGTE